MEGRVFKNNYKGHMDKTKKEFESGEGSGDGWGQEGVVGGKFRQLYLNNNKIIFEKCRSFNEVL